MKGQSPHNFQAIVLIFSRALRIILLTDILPGLPFRETWSSLPFRETWSSLPFRETWSSLPSGGPIELATPTEKPFSGAGSPLPRGVVSWPVTPRG